MPFIEDSGSFLGQPFLGYGIFSGTICAVCLDKKNSQILNNLSSQNKGFKPSKCTKNTVLSKMATPYNVGHFHCLLKTLKYKYCLTFWICPK